MTSHSQSDAVADALPPPDRLALFLDVDGTLVGTRPSDRPQRLDADRLETLRALEDVLGGALAVISGRAVSALDRFFHPLRLNAAGIQGIETRIDQGDVERTELGPADHAVLERLAHEVEALGFPVEFEWKGAGLTFVYEEAAPFVEELMGLVEMRLTAGLRAYRGVIAIDVVPSHAGKGPALVKLMRQAPFTGRLPVHFGDDLADESAFAEAAGGGGFGVSVRRPTGLTRYHLADHESVWQVLTAYRLRHA
ncbi:MAG: trehalose-phosphatase [Azospirillaceae bacterium]